MTKTTPAVESQSQSNPQSAEGEPTPRLRVGELYIKVTADTSEAIDNLELLEERALRTDARLQSVSGAGSLHGLLDTINTGAALLGVLVKASADTNAVTEATVSSVASRMASLLEHAEQVARGK